jgi:hypothetical protein
MDCNVIVGGAGDSSGIWSQAGAFFGVVVSALGIVATIRKQGATTRAQLVLNLNDLAGKFDATVMILEKMRGFCLESLAGTSAEELITQISEAKAEKHGRGQLDSLAKLESLREKVTKGNEKYHCLENLLAEYDYREARGFLRFCESVMLALETRVVSDGEIFTLLAYRLLLAANSPRLQKVLLTRDGGKRYNSAFCAIYALDNRIHRFLDRVYQGETDERLRDLGFDKFGDLQHYPFYRDAVREFHSRFRFSEQIKRRARVLWRRLTNG